MSEFGRGGQVMLEYVLALAGLLVVGTILGYFVVAANRHAERTENIVSSEYP